ncbi:hypothetical protein LguiA_030964 [Lonicera macranthoides]
MGGYNYGKHGDIETGNGGQLYPNMMESPEMRWAFIRKVYAILSIQMLMSVAIGATVATNPHFREIMATKAGLGIYIGICIFAIIRKAVLEAAILSSVVVVGLTLYTFWAAKRGYDFAFLGPFLFAAVLVLIVFSIIQIFFPFGKIGTMIIGCIGALVYSALVVYDTDNLIKRYSYDDNSIRLVNHELTRSRSCQQSGLLQREELGALQGHYRESRAPHKLDSRSRVNYAQQIVELGLRSSPKELGAPWPTTVSGKTQIAWAAAVNSARRHKASPTFIKCIPSAFNALESLGRQD